MVATSTNLVGVTSDCRPWPRIGSFCVCGICGHVQKLTDAEWRSDIDRIYSDYQVYFLSGGAEQLVFSAGTPMQRTAKLLEKFISRMPLARSGRLLDIGCGNGAFLHTFKNTFPDWLLFGFEQSPACQVSVEDIAGKGAFFCGSLGEIREQFDLVTMIYVIEHLPALSNMLDSTRSLLTPSGSFLIQTSDYLQNPFDLMVVDHCSHFSLNTLALAARRSGFQVLLRADDWIRKELGIVVCIGHDSVPTHMDDPLDAMRNLKAALLWLQAVVADARVIASRETLGIFGTAIAGTWLANALGGTAGFFVDEDPSRQGKMHLGRPVLGPLDVPAGNRVYLAFPYDLAIELHARLVRGFPGIRFVLPPVPAARTRAS